MSYEKSENFSGGAVAPTQFFARRLRQTRTRSVSYEQRSSGPPVS